MPPNGLLHDCKLDYANLRGATRRHVTSPIPLQRPRASRSRTATRSSPRRRPAPASVPPIAGSHHFEIRRAVAGDVPAIVALLAADSFGWSHEAADDLAPYMEAFAAIDIDPSELLVVLADGDKVIGTMQLSFLPGLSNNGAIRAQIGAVRVRDDLRGQGLGGKIMGWAIEEARRRDCSVVQLTTNKSRHDAHRFYERLGFVASHEGMKLALTALTDPTA
jgi:GNAT superfamily N-acetyltransferase